MDLTWAGLHTDFVRLDRLVGFLRSEGTCGVVLVMGKAPAAVVLNDGKSSAIFPEGDGDAARTADGWILVFSGRVEVPASQSPVSRPAPMAAPQPDASPPAVPHAEAAHPEAPQPAPKHPEIPHPEIPRPEAPRQVAAR
jgi:hypothetical protein